jgi:Mg2+-importing ATPase
MNKLTGLTSQEALIRLAQYGENRIPEKFAIALSVSVIPEALPLVVTFSLSRGALEFAEKKVLVKRLSSIQDLGLVNLLCTDKTGTLTENSLHVVSIRPVAATSDELLLAGRFASTRLDVRYPEPFDVACDEALSPELRAYLSSSQLLEEEAFDPKLRSNGARWKTPEGINLHIRRGSPEAIASTGLNMNPADQDWVHLEESRGHRVLALSRDVGNAPELAGYLSFSDRLKSTAAQTIQEAEGLNVLITIITGDSAAVAESVAREAGLVREASEVILSEDFFELPLPEREDRIGNIRVFARTTPEQKLELIHMLKKKYNVGYLGEGINDAPALRSAHVSMVVPSAADIAREASDIILLDSDLQVIVEGIRMGRRIHANIMKYIRGTLISNFGNFYAVAIGTLLVTFLPMLPRQLLLLNLLSDFPMISLAFDKVSEEELAEPKEVHPHGLYTTIITLGLVSTVFDFIFFALFFQRGAGVLQTNWFIASVLTELLLVFSIRSMMPAWKSGAPSGILTGLTLISMAAAILLPYFPMTADFFGFQPPSIQDLLLIFLMTLLYGMSNEIAKKPLARGC